MKIAIQGHPTRGKEVIQILESLGGINDGLHEGNNPDCYYELHSNIIWCVSTKGINFKYYTLEEFEKEFPFKIGDKVLRKGGNKPYEIRALELFMNKLCYRLDNGFLYGPKALTTYKEMKEERNITLTFDKAKEWYKKGGDLKQVALQAFTEKELNPLPRSWEEFCEKYPVKETEAVICCDSSIADCKGLGEKRDSEYYRYICPSKKSAEAHLAMIQLEQLRNCWWGDWRPEWSNNEKYVIKWEGNNLIAFTARRVHAFLVFPTIEMAGEFLECFRDLIEKAGDLI